MALSIVNEIKFSLTDDYKLPGIAPEIAKEARGAEKTVIGGILQNEKSFKQHLAYLSYSLRAAQSAFCDPEVVAATP
jgi:hypothetical protein